MPDVDAQSHILSSNEDTSGDLAIVAKKLYDEKKYEQALKIYSDMLLYSADSDLYVKMGNCFDKMGKGQTAIEYWDKAIEVDSMNSNAYINFGNYYYKKNQIEKAIGYWLASLIPMPEEPTSNLNLAVAYTLKEMHMEAFFYYERYLKFAQDKNSNKYLSIQKKIERDKKLGNDYLKLGFQYQSNGDSISALKCYKRAAVYCPVFSKIHLNIGSLYYADKNYEEAVKYWTNALYIDSNYPKIINNLAISYDMMQKYDYAYCYYSRYSKFVANKQAEIDKITARCHKIKPFLNANPYLINNHLEIAEDAFSDCDYKRALNEYKNYVILNPEAQEDYIKLIIKIENYLNPDKGMIESCLFNGRKLLANNSNYEEAKSYFARVMVLADSSSQEYKEAKGLLTLCLQH